MQKIDDRFVAAAFREQAEKLPAWDARGPTPSDLAFANIVYMRAEELQKAAENPARTTCKTCGGMMVNPRPCRADNCGFRK